MLTNQLKEVTNDYNDKASKALNEVYKQHTGLDINEFFIGVQEDVKAKKALAEENEEPWDTAFEDRRYINEKAEEAFSIALSQYKKDHNIDFDFEETYDAEGNSILEFGVTQTIKKYTLKYVLDTELTFGELESEDIKI